MALKKNIAYLLQYMAGIFTVAKCYFLPNFSLLRFLFISHIEREAKDCFSAYSFVIP